MFLEFSIRSHVIPNSTIGSTDAELAPESFAPVRDFFEHPHYVDLGPISRGAFGDVRRVRDTRFSQPLAMKITRRCIGPESRVHARFATEIEIMRSLRHPGILAIHDEGQFEDGRRWFTMNEIQGQTLAVVLDELHALDAQIVFQSLLFRRALEALAQFCQIVDFAHDNQIIHRDLKPKNLMISDQGEMFVIDWGIAKQLTPDPNSASSNGKLEGQRIRTEPGDVLGTPAYMPPEQALGDIFSQSSASDVYSLGAVLYHLLAGRPPYRGTRPSVIAQIKRGPPPPISTVMGTNRAPPRELVALCEATMQRQPAKRISRALCIMQDIREWLSSAAVANL